MAFVPPPPLLSATSSSGSRTRLLQRVSQHFQPTAAKAAVCVNLDVEQLRDFLQTIVPLYTNDLDLIQSCQTLAQGLQNPQRIGQDWHDLELALEAFLKSPTSSPKSPNLLNVSPLPPTVLFTAHSFCGLLQASHERWEPAHDHFTTALWVASHHDMPLAVATHRLAKSYVALGHAEVAHTLFSRAVELYHQEQPSSPVAVGRNHPCMLDATTGRQQTAVPTLSEPLHDNNDNHQDTSQLKATILPPQQPQASTEDNCSAKQSGGAPHKERRRDPPLAMTFCWHMV